MSLIILFLRLLEGRNHVSYFCIPLLQSYGVFLLNIQGMDGCSPWERHVGVYLLAACILGLWSVAEILVFNFKTLESLWIPWFGRLSIAGFVDDPVDHVWEVGLPQHTTPGTPFLLFPEKGVPWSEVPRDLGSGLGQGLALTNSFLLTLIPRKRHCWLWRSKVVAAQPAKVVWNAHCQSSLWWTQPQQQSRQSSWWSQEPSVPSKPRPRTRASNVLEP